MTAPTQNHRPAILAPQLDQIPAELRARSQWVAWRLVWRPGKAEVPGKWTKPPFQVSGKAASATDPATWATFDAAVAAWQDRRNRFDGIGFVFGAGDPHFGVDLDSCRDPETGELTPEAQRWVDRFSTYAEVSPSGTGVKLIGIGALPEGMSGRRDAAAGVEVYDQARFFTVTGHRIEEAPETVEPAQEALSEFVDHYFPRPVARPQQERRPQSVDAADDAALIARALNAADGAKFGALWNGNTSGYPGASEADAALASKLGFWCGPDPVRIEQFMRRSGLCREKWDEKRGEGTYLSYTIRKMLEKRTEFYTPGARSERFEKGANNSNNSSSPIEGDGHRDRERGRGFKNPFYKRDIELFEKTAPWDDDPTPLGSENLPPFPSHVLPSVLRDFAEGVAASVGTAPDLPGVQVLAAVAAATQKRIAVRLKADYTEQLSLWVVSIAPPGARKSPILSRVRSPFARVEAEENTRTAPDVAAYLSDRRILEAALTTAEKNAAKTGDKAPVVEARQILQDLAPVRPLRLLADDATPEALGVMLSENGGRLAVLDSEGVVFGHMSGRYTDKPSIEIFLKAWSGDSFTSDRAGKDSRSYSVANPAISLGVAIQPGVLNALRGKKELVGVGALARCLFSFAEDSESADTLKTPAMPEGVEDKYRELIASLLALRPTLGIDDMGEALPHFVTLTDDAAETFDGFYVEVRQEKRAEGETPLAEWLAKLHGQTLRIAGVLHLARHGVKGTEEKIDRETIDAAIELGWYFYAHARAALARIREGDDVDDARRILAWVKRNRKAASAETIPLGELRRQIKGIATEEEMLSALAVLASHGYARETLPEEKPAGTPGRKPGPLWQFHPTLTWETEA